MAARFSNATVAGNCLALTIVLFLYYFLWVSVVPFILIRKDNWIFSLFPPLTYSFMLPVTSGTLFIISLAAYTVYQVGDYLASRNSGPLSATRKV